MRKNKYLRPNSTQHFGGSCLERQYSDVNSTFVLSSGGLSSAPSSDIDLLCDFNTLSQQRLG